MPILVKTVIPKTPCLRPRAFRTLSINNDTSSSQVAKGRLDSVGEAGNLVNFPSFCADRPHQRHEMTLALLLRENIG